jgi:Autographiviridae RNA polymerase
VRAATYLSPIVWEAISGTVSAAREAMQYIKDVTRPLSKANKMITWRTPTGWLCVQRYPKMLEKRVETWLEGSIVKPVLLKESPKINSRKSSSAVSANFVHSMDASAMVACILRCHEEGVQDFSMIHDSYGCHATKMPLMARVLREEFVKMYTENDVLKQLRDRVIEELGPEVTPDLPELPARGSFNLDLVRTSPYFFA